jgi:hypothetical protein
MSAEKMKMKMEKTHKYKKQKTANNQSGANYKDKKK